MANLKSSKKQARKNIKQHSVNLARKTALKTAIKKVLDAVAVHDATQARAFLREAESRLGRSKGKKLIHANNAARRISRLAKKVSAVKKAAK